MGFLAGGIATSSDSAGQDAKYSEQMERCTLMLALWARYHPVLNAHHDGQVAIVVLGHHRCEQARFAEGIPALEKILRQGRIRVPPTVGHLPLAPPLDENL